MSKYTTELRFILENLSGLDESKGYDSVDEIVSKSREKIFSFNYPIFDLTYKETLETKILKHYYTREICAETVGRWKLFLETEMNEIMPYYNKLYESAKIEFDPFFDADYRRSGTKDNIRTLDTDVAHTGTIGDSGTTNGTRTDNLQRISVAGGSDNVHNEVVNKNDHWDLYSDTPQGGIAGIQGAEDDPSLGDNAYLTNARHIIDDSTGSESDGETTYGRTDTVNDTGTQTNVGTNSNTRTLNTNDGTDGTITDDGEFTEWIRGKFPGKSYSELLEQYRKTFLNIDMMIINELKDLFFNLW